MSKLFETKTTMFGLETGLKTNSIVVKTKTWSPEQDLVSRFYPCELTLSTDSMY